MINLCPKLKNVYCPFSEKIKETDYKCVGDQEDCKKWIEIYSTFKNDEKKVKKIFEEFSKK